MYRNELLALVRVLHQAVREEVLPVLNASQPHMTRDAPDGNAPQGHLASQFMQAIEAALLRAALRCGGLPQWAERMAAQQVQRVDRQVVQTIGSAVRTAFGIDITSLMLAQEVRTQIHAARAVNVQLITSIQRQYFDKIGTAVLQGVMQGKRASALAKEIEQISDATASRAKFIARDQTSKMNAAFNEIRQVGLGIESYTWQTSADERVREDHAAHDGTVFRWSDPPATGHRGRRPTAACGDSERDAGRPLMITLDVQLTQRRKTPEGYLIVPARFARTGIQHYAAHELGLSGADPQRVIRVYRPPEEVFAAEAIASFDGRPITDEHPDEEVTAENWRAHAVGFARNPRREGEYLVADLTITDEATIERLKLEQELSGGTAPSTTGLPGLDPGRATPTRCKSRSDPWQHIATVAAGRADPSAAADRTLSLPPPLENTLRSKRR
ncbi:DUF2213 domain-containing protein [Xylella fastidiosa]|uniref:DUF2213 domain-containing protein n=5 Tax=Xylella fastidiosa TaxID=2371 RepID=UPI0024171CEE|nr:DUF2213 domain-containing protein [Xylella fastidiosa]MDG4872839.1 DUF2213 domain-containing protein [Xylella fastidiosa subsp. multiplex]